MPGDSTTAVHADRGLADLPDVAPAIRPSTTFDEGSERRYRRDGHETTERFEAVVGAMEHGHSVAYASGMAAVAAVLDHVDPARIALDEDVYHGVRRLIERRVARGRSILVGPDGLAEGDLRWIETPSNPYGSITDLEAAASHARSRGAVTACDATLATPVGSTPLAHGIDLSIHATTKAIAGHSDAMGGVVSTADADRASILRGERTITGAVPGALDVWLALRGVRTLPLRMERASASAGAVASWFAHRGVATWYPGLTSHPGHGVAREQMRLFGSIVAVDLGSQGRAEAFIGALRVFTNATSLGGVESLVERRARSDPSLPPGLVRLSVGIEDVEDLLADLAAGFAAAGPERG